MKKFSDNDVLVNKIKVSQRFEFFIDQNGNFLLKNREKTSQNFRQNEIGIKDFLTSSS
jgi:hypothetical protein